MIRILFTVALLFTASFASANSACTNGNAAFCDISGPAGPQGPVGATGDTGPQGATGPAGMSGESVDASALAALTAIGSLQMTPTAIKQSSWAFGIGGQFSGQTGIAFGFQHGFTDTLSGYATFGTSGGNTSYGLGVSGRF